MSCCFGGVCIPYTAIVPVILLGIKWIVQKITQLGILPPFIAKALGINRIPNTLDKHTHSTNCDDDTNKKDDTNKNNDTNKKQRSCCTTSTTTSSSSPCQNTTNVVVTVTTHDQWNALVLSHKKPLLVVQFTAQWCQPCHAMAPLFAELALQYPAAQFCTIDVDDMEEIASSFQIVMMPTFVCLNGTVELGRKSGSQVTPLKELIACHIPRPPQESQ